MPIIKMVPKYCYCAGKPDPKSWGEGTVWECDNPDCQEHWELRFRQLDGLCWVRLFKDK